MESCAFRVAPEVDVEAGGEAVAFLFAEVGDPAGAVGEGFGVGAFGHEEDVGGVDAVVWGEAFVDLMDDLFDFGEIVGGGEDEFPLALFNGSVAAPLYPPAAALCEGAKDGDVETVFFVGLGEAAVFAIRGRRVGQLRGDGGEVDGVGGKLIEPERSGGFDGDVLVVRLEGADEGDEFFEHHRLAAGEDNVIGGMRKDLGEDLVCGEVGPFRVPRGVGGIAPGAAEVAAGRADEDGGNAGELSFALDGVENLGDAHCAILADERRSCEGAEASTGRGFGLQQRSMLERTPAIVAAVCLTIYWGYVPIKGYRLRRKHGKAFNALPREELLSRFLWYPCILVLLVGLWMAALGRPRWMLLGWLWEPNVAWAVAAAVAMPLVVVCTVLTFVCWRKMGKSWRIGINSGEKLDLVSTGPYRFVRHPIYALRMLIDVCLFVMVPVPLVLLAAGGDFLLLQLEARREERYMESQHGMIYANYKNSVGRFVPRVFVV